MKALSVRDPWASMICSGEKTIEVRSWSTNYRGQILICCTQKPKTENSGKAICIAELKNIRPLKSTDKDRAGGFYRPGLNAWELSDIKPIKPFPIKGQQGLFSV